MQDRPTVLELLGVVQKFISDELVPVLEGRRRYHALVAANVLAIVARELASEAIDLTSELRGLEHVLGDSPSLVPQNQDGLRSAVRALNERLVERIRNGDADAGEFASRVRAHVRDVVDAKLRVANPGYLAAD